MWINRSPYRRLQHPARGLDGLVQGQAGPIELVSLEVDPAQGRQGVGIVLAVAIIRFRVIQGPLPLGRVFLLDQGQGDIVPGAEIVGRYEDDLLEMLSASGQSFSHKATRPRSMLPTLLPANSGIGLLDLQGGLRLLLGIRQIAFFQGPYSNDLASGQIVRGALIAALNQISGFLDSLPSY